MSTEWVYYIAEIRGHVRTVMDIWTWLTVSGTVQLLLIFVANEVTAASAIFIAHLGTCCLANVKL